MLLRGFKPRDRALILNSWLSNYRKGYHVKGVPNDVYFTWHHKILEEIIARCPPLIACDPEDPDTIYGWVCAEVVDNQLVIHYIYVKQMVKAIEVGAEGEGEDRRKKFKGWGVGTFLLKAILDHEPDIEGITYTHETMAGRGFLRALWDKDILPFEPVYNPYLLYSTLQPGWAA